MNRAPWTIVLAFVLVLGIGIGAVAGGVHTPAAHGNRASASPNSPLTPAVCSYPTVDNSATFGGAPATGSFTTTTGDLLIVYESNAAFGGTPVSPAISDGGTDSWTQGPVSLVTTAGHEHSSSYFTATAAASGAQSFSIPSGTQWSVIDIYELAPSGGDVLSFGVIANETGAGSLSVSAANGNCALGMTFAADDFNNPSSATVLAAPVGWTNDGSSASFGGGSIASTLSSATIAASGTESATFTGGAHVGDGVMITYGAAPPPPQPPAPTGLTATTISSTEIDLAWTNPSVVTYGLVDSFVNQSLGAGCSSPTPINLGSVATSYAATGLAPATEFSFEVSAANATGQGATSTCVDAFTLYPAPPAPTNVVASTEPLDPPHDYGLTLIDLTWTASSGGGLIGTNVSVFGPDCSTPVAGPYAESGSATGATIGSLTAGTTYCFEVSSSTNGGEGPFSTPTSAAINTTLPNAPTAVIVTAASTALFSIAWTDPSGNLTGFYTAEAFAPNDCGGVVLFTVTGSLANPYSWGIVSAGDSACVEVAANTSGGMGPFSTPTSTSINATLPDPVTGATNATVSSSEINLAWTNPGGNLTVVVIVTYAGGSCGGSPLTVSSLGVTTSYHATGLNGSTTYSFAVIPYTSGGAGSFSCLSNSTFAPPPPPLPPPPSPTGILFGLLLLALVLLTFLAFADSRRKETR